MGVRFIVMTLLVFVAGGWARVFRDVRALPWTAQAAVYFATGLVTLPVEMMVMTVVGVRWSVLALLALPVAGLLGCWVVERRALSPLNGSRRDESRRAESPPLHYVGLLALIVFASTVLSAAATSGDFVFFWGTKGQHFGQVRMLDAAFLRDPAHNVMHPDYPPLVPLYYAWTMLGSGELDWFGAMASAILFLALASAAVSGFVRDARFTALFASMFALLFIRNSVAGNAEPALLFFEVLALAALLAKNDVVAAIALSGVALTKIEGGVFVLIVVALLWRRKLAAVPLIVLALWLLFAKTNGLLDAYVPNSELSSQYVIPALLQLMREMSFGLWYAPWIAIALMMIGGRMRNAIPYLIATLAFLGFMVVIYARAGAHMEWSAQRVLMTPLAIFFSAATFSMRAADCPSPDRRPGR